MRLIIMKSTTGGRTTCTGALGLLLVNNFTRQLEGQLSVSREQGAVFENVFPLQAR